MSDDAGGPARPPAEEHGADTRQQENPLAYRLLGSCLGSAICGSVFGNGMRLLIGHPAVWYSVGMSVAVVFTVADYLVGGGVRATRLPPAETSRRAAVLRVLLLIGTWVWLPAGGLVIGDLVAGPVGHRAVCRAIGAAVVVLIGIVYYAREFRAQVRRRASTRTNPA